MGHFALGSPLFYSAFYIITENIQGTEDDSNTVATGTMTGMLCKCTGGLARLTFPVSMLGAHERILALKILSTYQQHFNTHPNW
jgi:hypothetical protein